MYWQSEYLREGATATRNATYRIDLPEQGLLSGLVIEASAPATSGATLGGGKWRLIDFLNLVEVVGNGATPILSLYWKNLAYLAWLKQKVAVPHFWRNYATNTYFDYLFVPFGRYYKDQQYGLDLSRWDNVELRIANDGTSTYLGDDISLDIKQIFLREGGAFSGYVRREVWREWTTVQNETKYLTLPTEFPIAGVHLQCIPPVDASFVAETGMANEADDVDFKKNGGMRQIFKGGIDHLMVENYLEAGAYAIHGGHIDITADKGAYFDIGRSWSRQASSGSLDGAGSSTIPTIQGDNTDFSIKPETREADSPIEILVNGMAPFESVFLWHEPMLRPEFMLNPGQDAPMTLDVHTRDSATADNGTNRVLLERLVAG